jgi:hypothetical protein
MINLRQLAGDRFRVALDPSAERDDTRAERPWYQRAPGRYGFIGVHGPDTLMAYCHAPRLFPKLVAIPDSRVRQRGDHEIAVAFAPEHLERVADILHACRRRRLSPQERERRKAQAGKARLVLSRTHQAPRHVVGTT